MKRETIGGAQLLSILFVSRLIALFTFTAPQEEGFSSGDRVLFTLPFFLICLLACVPVFLTVKQPGQTLTDAAGEVSPLLQKSVGGFYCAAFLLAAALSAIRFELFVNTLLFPESGTLFFTVLLLATAAAAASRGIQALGRASFLALVLMGAALLFILLSTADKFDPVNLTPPLEDGLPPVLKNAFRSASRTMEIVSLGFAPAFCSGSVRKTGIGWLASFSAVAAAVFFFICGVTGRYGEQQMFQLSTVTEIARFGVLDRMDALLAGVWIFGALLRTAYFLRLAGLAAEQGFGKQFKTAPYFAGTGIVLGLFFLFSALASATDGAATILASEILFIASTVIAPGMILMAKRRKRRLTVQT